MSFFDKINKDRMSKRLTVAKYCEQEKIDVETYNEARKAYSDSIRKSQFKIQLDPPSVIKKRYEGFSYKTGFKEKKNG